MNSKDYTEFEAKFYPVNKDEYRVKLQSIGAKLVISERKMIRVVGDRRANPILPEHANIRIRDEGDLIRLSLKVSAGGSGKVSDQKEIDVEVSDFDKTVKIIEATGIKLNRRQETLREEWEYGGAQITIDTWPGLDVYSEIEADSEEKVKEVAEELGFDWSKKIVVPAVEIYCKVYELDIEKVLDMTSDITFKNNPFENLKKVWP